VAKTSDKNSAGIAALVDDALVVQMNVGEVRMRIPQVELDGASLQT